MSWGSTTRLRRIGYMRSFEQAKKKYETTKPIRGRADETIRPLSDRDAVDQYSIRKVVDADKKVYYECWLYRTPVLAYHQNGDIVIDMGNWASSTTRKFIAEITGLPCGVKGGVNYISLGEQKVVLPKNGPTVVRRNDSGWELVKSAAVTEIQLDRKAANAVRKRYKDFADYVKNMVKLRGEEVQLSRWQTETTTVVKIDYAEMKEGLGGVPAWGEFSAEKSDKYKKTAGIFFGLVAPREGEADPTDFYTAFLLLVASTYNVRYWGTHTASRPLNVSPERLLDKLKELQYKYHSDEVFERVELPTGELPCKKYESWV